MSIRTAIVDDETLSRRGIEIRLRAASDFEIVAQCANGREALAAIQAGSSTAETEAARVLVQRVRALPLALGQLRRLLERDPLLSVTRLADLVSERR